MQASGLDDLPGPLAGACLFPLDTPIAALPVAGYRRPGGGRPRGAAVLIGLTETAEPEILLTRRSRNLRRHAGQVAFPGGGREPGDRSVVDTALRETSEETGLPRQAIHPLAYLGRYDTLTGYRITAVVGQLEGGHPCRPDGGEIEEVFFVPLQRVCDPGAYRREQVRANGQVFEILTLDHPGQHIWGATAALLHQLGTTLRPG